MVWTEFERSRGRRLRSSIREPGPLGAGVRFNYAVSHDGERFLIQTNTGQSRPAPIVVVLDWVEELTRLAPTN